jgi:hypothetical protein
MKLHLKKVYYKNIRRGQEPCKYEAIQPGGKGTDVYATVKLDPILRKKKLKPILKGMLKHEKVEITEWAKGKEHSHNLAQRAEPSATKDLGGVRGFWNAVGRMEKKGEIR